MLRFTVTHPANGRTYVLEFSFFGFVVDMMAEFALIGTADFKSAPNRDAPKHTGDKRFAQLTDDDGNLGFIVVSNLEGNLAFVNSLGADGKEKGVTGISGHGVVDARLVSWCALHLAGRLFAAFITFVFTTINTWAKLSGPAFIAVAKAVRDAIKFDLQLKTKKYTSRLMVSNQGGNAARHAFQRWLPFSDVILAMIPHDERHGPRVRLVGRLLGLGRGRARRPRQGLLGRPPTPRGRTSGDRCRAAMRGRRSTPVRRRGRGDRARARGGSTRCHLRGCPAPPLAVGQHCVSRSAAARRINNGKMRGVGGYFTYMLRSATTAAALASSATKYGSRACLLRR